MNINVKYQGYEIEIGKVLYVFAPLSLGSIEKLQDKIQKVSNSENLFNEIGSIIDIAFLSLKRNYIDITREEVADLIDTKNVEQIFTNIMGTSGMVTTDNSGVNVGDSTEKK